MRDHTCAMASGKRGSVEQKESLKLRNCWNEHTHTVHTYTRMCTHSMYTHTHKLANHLSLLQVLGAVPKEYPAFLGRGMGQDEKGRGPQRKWKQGDLMVSLQHL